MSHSFWAHTDSPDPTGDDLLVLTAVCTRACLMVASAHLTRGTTFDALALNTVQTAFNAMVFTVLAGAAIPPAVRCLDATQWGVFVFLALGCACAAFLAQLWAIQHTSATRASLVMGTEPLWALAVGVTFAGDHLTPLAALGALITIAATITGQRIEARWRTTPEPGHRLPSTSGQAPTPEGCSPRPKQPP